MRGNRTVLLFPSPLLAADGSSSAPSYSFASDPDTGIYDIGGNSLGFVAGGSIIGYVDTVSFTVQQDLKLNTIGKGIYVRPGTNATFGTATLSGNGSVNVLSTKTTANSAIFVAPFGGGNTGTVAVTTRTNTIGFTVVSSSAADTRTFSWWIIEPSTA